jgi:hypothetical protein
MARQDKYPRTPDGRYFVSKGRLWRCTNPALPEKERRALVKALMKGRLGVRNAASEEEMRAARAEVDAAKHGLGERGPVWWDDGAEPVDRHAPKNTPYAAWWDTLTEEERAAGM